jgi:hypothetical protein
LTDCEEAVHQLLTDVQESGWTHFVVDPVREVVDLARAIEIASVPRQQKRG